VVRETHWPGSKVLIATKPAAPGPFQGLPAQLASNPLDPAVRGGLDGSFVGVTDGPSLRAVSDRLGIAQTAPEEEPDEFQGAGPLLEEDDATVFQTLDGLVQRQEILALNHLAQDTHWTYVKLGYPWSTLEKDPNRSRYRQFLPYGSAGVTIQAVPNKAWDLINKTTEALLVDFPQVECEPGDSSEEAEAACEMAERFLTQDASEQGTNDAVLFWDRVQRSMTCASAYLECWTDPTGGGYVPLAIPAHPQAESPKQPLIGPDGTPTDSPVMRYVTKVGPDGQPTDDSQFTTDASQAAPQWQPKLRASKWQREHIRVFPETVPVEHAQKVIILGYCTLDEAKRRWPAVAAMDPDELSKLCDWQPPRYLVLLPLFLRGRWQLTDGRDKNKQGSSDERIMFYYHAYAKASPDHPKGADVVVTGALGKKVLDKKLLSTEVETPQEDASEQPQADPTAANLGPDSTPQPPTTKETRCMEIPVVQITPRVDPDDQDPSGRAYLEMSAGAIENNAHLAMSASEVIDKNLHLEGYSSSTSPINGAQREDSRATGSLIPLIRPEDKPTWGESIPFEQAFFNFYELSDQAINSIGSAERAAKGQDNASEKSGKAIALATANNNVSLGGMNHAVNNAYTRWCRIKLERMMCDFTTQQQISYVGEDGIFKQEAFDAIDFALVGKVTVKAGTGGLITPDQKIQNLIGLAQAQILTHDEAADAVRPAVSQKIGLPASPHEQRIERQISAFKKGPPDAEWVGKWQAYQQQKQAFEDMQARSAQASGAQLGQPPIPGAPQPSAPTAMQKPVPPWTPWTPMPTDELPLIAQMRSRKLANLIDEAKFESYPGEWQQTAFDEFQRMQQVIAASTPPAPLPKGVVMQAKAGDAASLAAEEQAAINPKSAPPPAPKVPTQPAAPAGVR
jgi:hypothetical protein